MPGLHAGLNGANGQVRVSTQWKLAERRVIRSPLLAKDRLILGMQNEGQNSVAAGHKKWQPIGKIGEE